MPQVTGKVEPTWTRSPGPPPTVALTGVRIVGGRAGDGVLDVEPVPAEWAAKFELLSGKIAQVDYTADPFVISQVKGL